MRHAVVGKKLNRDSQHRVSLFKNLVRELIIMAELLPPPPKAKAVQGLIDKLMTKAKKGGVHQRRLIDHMLNQTKLVNKLVDVIAPTTKDRVSGFTRTTKLASRMGDNAPQVSLEWVDQLAPITPEKTDAKVSKKKDAKKVTDKPKSKTKVKSSLATPPQTLEPKVQSKTNAPKPGMIRQKSGER
jgi:large subunit ribosomal protein L17